jgi:hypothetical protein
VVHARGALELGVFWTLAGIILMLSYWRETGGETGDDDGGLDVIDAHRNGTVPPAGGVR